MQRIIVDLPEPDGPQTTMRSPCSTVEVDVVQHMELAVPFVDMPHRSIDGASPGLRRDGSWSLMTVSHRSCSAFVPG